MLFTYDSTLPSTTNKKGVYTVRTSGYSRFAQYPVVRDGAKGDIMAIFGIYSKDWTYNYGAYQCTVNYFDDIMFDKDAFLTEAEVEELTPGRFMGYARHVGRRVYRITRSGRNDGRPRKAAVFSLPAIPGSVKIRIFAPDIHS